MESAVFHSWLKTSLPTSSEEQVAFSREWTTWWEEISRSLEGLDYMVRGPSPSRRAQSRRAQRFAVCHWVPQATGLPARSRRTPVRCREFGLLKQLEKLGLGGDSDFRGGRLRIFACRRVRIFACQRVAACFMWHKDLRGDCDQRVASEEAEPPNALGGSHKK